MDSPIQRAFLCICPNQTCILHRQEANVKSESDSTCEVMPGSLEICRLTDVRGSFSGLGLPIEFIVSTLLSCESHMLEVSA